MGGTRQGGEAAATVVRQLADSLPEKSPEHLCAPPFSTASKKPTARSSPSSPIRHHPRGGRDQQAHTIRPYHVGDSVILVVGQRGKLKLQTISHSPGRASASRPACSMPRRPFTTTTATSSSTAVGSTEMRIELGAPLALARHDTLLLASDGLTDNLSLDEIVEIIRKGPLDRPSAKLAALARDRMDGADAGADTPSKPDDLTIVGYRRSG